MIDLPTVARVNVNLPLKAWEALEVAAEEDGITRTEALRRAISVDLFFRARWREGTQVVLDRRDGSSERVVSPGTRQIALASLTRAAMEKTG
jgi:hypothetical protein